MECIMQASELVRMAIGFGIVSLSLMTFLYLT
jgi:hypothetical protein